MPSDTRTLLGTDAAKCDSRSLYLDRFADPRAKDSGDHHPRRDWFNALRGKPALSSASDGWCEWLHQITANGRGQLIFAQLQSRLMVNMAGSVMENAGLCLDRFGVPYIPGSAVKACARRMAIQDLLDHSQTDKPVEELAKLLSDIGLIFGWSDTDWKAGRKRKRQGNGWIETEPFSDFWWAMADDSGDRSADSLRSTRWTDVAEKAAGILFKKLRAKLRESDKSLAPQLPNFAGSVSFLPAYPITTGANGLPLREPELGALDLDVVTCHHGDYYASNDPNAKAEDIEEPVPVVFPAIAAGHVFVFAMLPLGNCSQELVQQAYAWLSGGLETFGLGAKTAAGYGWLLNVTDAIRAVQDAKKKQQTDKDRQAREQAEREAARANLQPDQDLLEELRTIKEPNLRGYINVFATEERFWTQKDERRQLTVLHFLLVTSPDSFATDQGNSKSKIAKAIAHLSAKFPHVASPKP